MNVKGMKLHIFDRETVEIAYQNNEAEVGITVVSFSVDPHGAQ